MASLTPGVLSKLLENAGSKVTPPHRQALLQVTEIVPRLSSTSPLQTRGYFLKLSDSLHSAYVSVPDSDADDLIRSGKLHLGHFVYVTRLDAASPVPLVRGLTLLPKRRPCVGNPTELVPSERLLLLSAAATPKKKKREEKGLEMRRLSLDSSSRRVWDHTPLPSKGKTTTASSSSSASNKLKAKKSNTASPNVIDKKVSSVKPDSPLKSPTSSTVSPLKNKNENLCPKSLTSTTTPPRKSTTTTTTTTTRSPCGSTVLNSQLVKVPLNFKTWCYDEAPLAACWEDVSPPICDLGKQVAAHRNVAFLAAVRSLEEASATDTVIQCMCMYAELCQSDQTCSAGSIVKQFLELHLSLKRVRMVFDSLLTLLTEDACNVPNRKNAVSWVQAAIGTNLSKFNLFETQAKREVMNGHQCHYVVIENSPEDINIENSPAQNKQNRVTQANSTAKRLPSSKRNLMAAKNKDTAHKQDRPKETELKEAASLTKKLLEASSEWFLKYLEESLSNEFGLNNEGNTEIASLLGQLKHVNDWLDNLAGGDKVDHRVEKLRKKLYRFLLEHVNSTVASSRVNAEELQS